METIENIVKRVFYIIERIEILFAGIGLLTVTLLIFAQVLNRYWLGLPIMWLENLALHIFVWTIIMTLVITTAREHHAKLELSNEVILKNKPMAQNIHRLIIVIVSIVTICIFLPIARTYMIWGLRYPEYDTLVRWMDLGWARTLHFIAYILIVLHLLRIAGREVTLLVKTLQVKSQVQRGK